MVKAAVVLKPGYEGKVTEEEIINFCRERLAVYKVPREVVFKSELPATVSGLGIQQRKGGPTPGTRSFNSQVLKVGMF